MCGSRIRPELPPEEVPKMKPPAPIPFSVGRRYSREEIFTTLGIDPHPTGGNWFTGYNRHQDDWFIFATVGAAGRTGHDYDNRWEGDLLRWRGKTGSHLQQDSIRSMLHPRGRIFVFTRTSDRDPFTYEGAARAERQEATTPVTIWWRFDDPNERPAVCMPEEVRQGDLAEGAVRSVTVNAYERNRTARGLCIAHYGCDCQACGFDFRAVYGDLGRDYIHVHHIKPLAEVGAEYEVDPVADLRPVCANCHAMLHRREPPLTIEELRGLIAANRG
jgi:5-methylcytosine-specific restriction protein A